ncbi:MAG: division/cell wall cluster transcriptional repressor MraZ [candidate division KSB1 bacterium]|nr:division/cell wall cluster transcriptional repressor MraZ [candidate division KSB1 bacterium]
MLLGEYHLNLDDKGRLSVPASVRHVLHELYAPDDTTLVITKFFENCLVLYPKAEWLNIQKQLLDLPNDSSARAFVRHFCASAHICTLDRQGRVLIPPQLRQYAEINGEALLIGIVKKLELWSPQRWEGYTASEAARFDTHERVMALRL